MVGVSTAAPDLTSQDRYQDELVESDFDSDLYSGGDGLDGGKDPFPEGKFKLSPDDVQVHQHKIPSNSDGEEEQEQDILQGGSSIDSKNPLFPVGSNSNNNNNDNGADERRIVVEKDDDDDAFSGLDQGFFFLLIH